LVIAVPQRNVHYFLFFYQMNFQQFQAILGGNN